LELNRICGSLRHPNFGGNRPRVCSVDAR